MPYDNCVDVYAQDLGFLAIVERGRTVGYNVLVGGGMGMTHGEPETYPRTADVMGYCRPQEALALGDAVVTVQRDWGDRSNRKHARLKYTIEDRGLPAFRTEVERRSGVNPRRFRRGDHEWRRLSRQHRTDVVTYSRCSLLMRTHRLRNPIGTADEIGSQRQNSSQRYLKFSASSHLD